MTRAERAAHRAAAVAAREAAPKRTEWVRVRVTRAELQAIRAGQRGRPWAEYLRDLLVPDSEVGPHDPPGSGLPDPSTP